MPEHCHRLIARDSRIAFKEVRNTVPGLQMVNQASERHPGPAEFGSAGERLLCPYLSAR